MDLSETAARVKRSSTLAITAKANELKKSGEDVVAFSAGEPDFDTPEHIKRAAETALSKGYTKYTPEAGIADLRKAIASKLKNDNGLDYDYTQIIVSNGGKQALFNVILAVLNEGDEVIIPSPYWLSYPQMVLLAGGVCKFAVTTKETNYKITKQQLQSLITPKSKLLIINSPNNPTGMMYTKEELMGIAEIAIENDLLIISDEIYEKLVYGDYEHVSIASLGKEVFDRTIIINGFSKAYAMTGWRVGYSAAPEKITQLCSNIQSHITSNVNSIAQYAALAAVTGPNDCISSMINEYARRRLLVAEKLSEIEHIDFLVPSGAFYFFIDISSFIGKTLNKKTVTDAKDFVNMLLEEQKMVAIPCNDFGSDKHMRISYASSYESLEEGMRRLKAFVNSFEPF